MFREHICSLDQDGGRLVVVGGGAVSAERSSLLVRAADGSTGTVAELEQESFTPVDSDVTALCVVPGGRFVVAAHGEQHTVVLHSLPDLARHRTLMTCALQERLMVASAALVAHWSIVLTAH